MKTFSTFFPVSNESDLEDLLSIGKEWVSENRYCHPNEKQLIKLKKATNNGDIVDFSEHYFKITRAETEDYKTLGFSFSDFENKDKVWDTSVVGVKKPDNYLVSVTVDYATSKPDSRRPKSIRPNIIEKILDNLGGGKDGPFRVINNRFRPQEKHVESIAKAILGRYNNVLPIVYLSRDKDDNILVNPERLSIRLYGLAHVVIEPSRDFSFKLKDLTNSINAFNGAVGLYWPNNSARFFWLSDSLKEINDPVRLIQSEIISSSRAHRIPLELTFENIQSINNQKTLRQMREKNKKNMELLKRHKKEILELTKSKKDEDLERLKELKEKDESVLNELANELDLSNSELEMTKQNLYNAELEISRLKEGLSRKSNFTQSGPFISGPQMNEIYEGELRYFVLDSIKKSLDSLPKDLLDNSRKSKVLESVVKGNNITGIEQKREKIILELKSLLKEGNLNNRAKMRLKSLGFEIEEDGKHYKVSYGESKIIVSKTPSDSRAGKNITSELFRRLF